MKDDPDVLSAHALYLAKFVEEYGKLGLKIEAIHPQNEPSYAPAYPSCQWTSELFTRFIRDYLGPTFEKRQVPAAIWCGTMSAPEDGEHVSAVMLNAGAAKYIKGIGAQWNHVDNVAKWVTSYRLPVMQTEHRCGNYRWVTETYNPDKPPNDHAYAEESWGLIVSWIAAGVNSYSAWNMVLDTFGKNLNSEQPWPQNALLTVDRTAKTLQVTPAYYVFRHFSQFVDPGAKRIGTSVDTNQAMAFKNPDGSIVTVLHNAGNSVKKTTLAVGSAKLQFDIPARGWATVNWK
jgi:glucosylceramidase